jgi:hypothetical protein
MRQPRSFAIAAVLVAALCTVPALEAKPRGRGESKKAPVARTHPVPPVLLRHSAHPHGLPPGLAKKLGPRRPAQVYIALDPRRDDQAWFLLDDRWVLRSLPEASLRREIRALLDLGPLPLPPLPPPIPLPRPGTGLRLLLFD